jgi:hypothetical protein
MTTAEANMTTAEAKPGNRRSQSEEPLEILLGIVTQVQDGVRLEDRMRAEENEGGGIHMPIDRTPLTAEQRYALEAGLDAVDTHEADRDGAAVGHAQVERLGRKWLAEGWLTRKETAQLEEALRSLESRSREAP